jgi:putative Holliday junction resolvase
MQQQTHSAILALDVGERRIGVALANMQVRLASPLTTLQRSEASPSDIQALLQKHEAGALVIGLPRGLDGQHTNQTKAVEAFAEEVAAVVQVPLHWQDEAVTSRQAEAELIARGKPYKKEDIDALSAVYILEDYLRDHQGASV